MTPKASSQRLQKHNSMKLPTIAGLLLLGLISVVQADETDPKIILQKSADATTQLKSFKSDLVIESFASLTPQTGTIYQKKMPDGTMAMRMEMATPTNAMPQGMANISTIPASYYTLISSQGAYTVMGNKAISMNGMPGMDKLKNAMSPDALRKIFQDAQTGGVAYTLTNGVVDGKECWIVSISTSPAALEAVKKAMSEGLQKDLLEAAKMKLDVIPIPAKTVIYLDKQSYLMMKQSSISSNDKVIQSMTYKNFQANPDIPDSLFHLPDNIQIEDMSTKMQGLLKNIKPTK